MKRLELIEKKLNITVEILQSSVVLSIRTINRLLKNEDVKFSTIMKKSVKRTAKIGTKGSELKVTFKT